MDKSSKTAFKTRTGSISEFVSTQTTKNTTLSVYCDVERWQIQNCISPVTHIWARSYTLYSSPVGHLMEISSYSWIVHLKSDWSSDVWIKGVVWIWYRICIINTKVFFYIIILFCIWDLPTNRKIWASLGRIK